MKSLNTVSSKHLDKRPSTKDHSIALATAATPLTLIQNLFAICLAFALALFYSNASSANVRDLSMDFAIVDGSTDISLSEKNTVKQRNVCRAIRSDALGRSIAQKDAKELALTNGLSRYQQRAYRTRVGGMTRSSLRDLASNCWQ